MSIIKTLKKLGIEVFDSVDVNNGGCCVYASKVGEALQSLGYEVRVITAKPFKDSRNVSTGNNFKIKCPYKAENTLPVDFNHVGLAIKVKNSWYTHDALVTKRTLKKFGEWNDDVSDVYFTVDQAKSFSKKKDFWNPTFKRRSGGIVISRAIKKHLKGTGKIRDAIKAI